jgi:hypothetical protein
LRARRHVAAALGAIVLCLLVGASAAQAQDAYLDPLNPNITPAHTHAILALNAQRAANGLPSDIVENLDWNDGCRKHANYQQLNGGDLTHHEDPSKPGYTPQGALAGASSVLSSAGWDGDQNPWEMAPIHLMQLLGPKLSMTGYADGCMFTWPGYRRPDPGLPQIFSYPGPGTHAIYSEETASELPFIPGQFVGLPQGTTTGPHLYVLGFGTGFANHLTEASLTGPDGPLEVRSVDNYTEQVGSYLPPGGIIIPVAPLHPGTTYTAHAALGGLPYTWSFTTAKVSPELRGSLYNGTISDLYSKSPAPVTVQIRRLPSGVVVADRQLAVGEKWVTGLPGAHYSVSLSQPETDAWDAGSSESDETWRTRPRLKLLGQVRHGGLVSVIVRSGAPLAGRPLRVATRGDHRLRPRRVRAHDGQKLTFKLARHHAVRLTVESGDFSVGELLYGAASAGRWLR